MCSQGTLFTFLSLSVLVDKMGLTQIELLRGLHEVIPEKKTCVEQWRAQSRSSINMVFPGPWTVGWGGSPQTPTVTDSDTLPRGPVRPRLLGGSVEKDPNACSPVVLLGDPE